MHNATAKKGIACSSEGIKFSTAIGLSLYVNAYALNFEKYQKVVGRPLTLKFHFVFMVENLVRCYCFLLDDLYLIRILRRAIAVL